MPTSDPYRSPHKHAVAARQPHRDASMPNVGDGDEAEVEA